MICYVYMHYGVPENRMHLLMTLNTYTPKNLR